MKAQLSDLKPCRASMCDGNDDGMCLVLKRGSRCEKKGYYLARNGHIKGVGG